MKNLLTILLLVLVSLAAKATHNRAGEIQIEFLGGLTVRATVTTYTVPDSPADRPFLEVKWGDGTLDTVYRSNGPNGEGVVILPGVKKNVYVAEHTYPSGSATGYTISMEDPNRNGGIMNIPNSVNVPFYIETHIIFGGFLGSNTTPFLLNAPIDDACFQRIYEHNPGAYDPDGDSLSYELTTCAGEFGESIQGYIFPPGLSIDAVTGTLTWDSPQEQGEFNFAIKIIEWRRRTDGTYVQIGYTIRDMQVTVLPCNNNPPIVSTVDEICVEAGDTLEFLVRAWDPDGDPVTLTGTGGPLEQSVSPATFQQPVFAQDTAISTFRWRTDCDHVRLQPYTMSFRAEDDPPGVNEQQLVDYHTTFITVVGPAPENPQAEPQGDAILLSWDQSSCGQVVGYKVYRRVEEYGFVPDTCEVGVPGYTGYQFIGSTTGLTGTSFLDDNNGAGLTRGITYCYMVVACFPDGAVGYASEEFCAELKRDLPVITNVSVRNTDVTLGSMYVAWSKPTELDTIQIPGPYEYRVLRSDVTNPSDFQQVGTLFNLNDTIFIDTLMNTKELEFYYKIELFNDESGNEFSVGESDQASSVFIVAIGTDNQVQIVWHETVPWFNDTFEVYRQQPDLTFALIGETTEHTYVDTGLANGIERCYRVMSIGHYSIDGIIHPIENWSQESCATPIDSIPPCNQDISISSDCEELLNNLTWSQEPDCPDDIVEYQVLYTPTFGGELQVIATHDFPWNDFQHGPLANTMAGCYAIAAIDSFQNVTISDTVCVDQCSNYELPNVFTPGGDSWNDVFKPFSYAFVESIDMKIYNRWGLKIFETTDPDILWDGTEQNTKRDCSDGVYYYICTVNEIRLEGVVPRDLQGYIQLLRTSNPTPN